jgi:hypothetical protein
MGRFKIGERVMINPDRVDNKNVHDWARPGMLGTITRIDTDGWPFIEIDGACETFFANIKEVGRPFDPEWLEKIEQAKIAWIMDE